MTQNFIYRFGNVRYDLSSRTHIMGVLNVTPDSFSDGNRFFSLENAVDQALRLEDEGADIIDIGGESSRPGSEPVSADDEIKRVIPVIEKLSGKLRVPISIDTCKSAVAERALNAGAVIVNDISSLQFDPEIISVVVRHQATVVLMHMKGTPKTMQAKPEYVDLIGEVSNSLRHSILVAREKGVSQIIVDPGIGFGKTVEHNLQIIKNLREFHTLGYPVLIGPSRKSFIGAILGVDVNERMEGTAGAVSAAIMHGVQLVRVHDVKQIKRVTLIVDAILRA